MDPYTFKRIGGGFVRGIEDAIRETDLAQFFLQTENAAYGFYRKNGFTEPDNHVSFAKKL